MRREDGYIKLLIIKIIINICNSDQMILQYGHHHHSEEKDDQQDEGLLAIFNDLLEKTQQSLNQQTIKETQRLRRYYEEKVYLSYCDDPSQYLLHMLHKSHSHNSDQVAELIMERQSKVVTAIKKHKYDVKVNNEGEKIKKIKDQLTSKLQDLKHNFDNLGSPIKDQAKAEQIYKGYMQFRKRGYWNQETQQSKKVKHFLGKMKKQRKRMEEQHQKNLKKSEQAIQQQIEKDRKMKQQEQKKIFQEISKRRQKVKSQRKEKYEDHRKRIVEVNNFLQKYKTQKPVYILNEQKFKKQILEPQEQQKRRKLNEIKKNRRPIDASQLQLHEQRYEQFKQKLSEVNQKRQQDNELYEKNMQKLKQLYHGHYHERIQEEMNNYQNAIQQKRKQRQRINSYSSGIKQEFKPKIDPKKKEQIQNTMRLLQIKSAERGKKKIKQQDGSFVYEEISPANHKKLGVSYLQYLRKYNEGKPKKDPQDRSNSMMELSKKKITYPDYLQQMRSKSRVETATTNSRHGWRKIIEQQGYSNRDKYNSVMDHVSVLESEARQKQLQLKYMKNGTKAMQLKQKLDKYYLESVAAKMHVLKDVILKE